jgi:hypothetical protein
MKAVVGAPVASGFWEGRLGAWGWGEQTTATGHPAAEWVKLEKLPAVNPRQSGVLRVIASPELVRKNHGWWTGIKTPLTQWANGVLWDDNPLRIGTKEYRHGLGCPASSKVVVRLPGHGKTFSAIAGVEPTDEKAVDVFSVTVDDKVVFRSGTLKGKTEGLPVNVELGGASEFTLEVEAAGKKVDEWGGRGDWAEAKVELADGREVWLDEMLLCYPLESGPIETGGEERLNFAPFGYVYRPDRPAGENPSETQFINTGNATTTTPLGGILWAERRPIRRVELHFPAGHALDPKDLVLRLVAASWWKGAMSWAVLPSEPVVLDCTGSESNGDTLVYELEYPLLASHLSLHHKSTSEKPPIPEIQIFSDSALKKMKIEIEWGLAVGQEGRRFDGRLEAYNGRIEEIGPLPGKSGVSMQGKEGWRSASVGKNRRGIVAEVSYVYNDAVTHGNFKKTWWPNRTVVTVWTSSGSFSFVPRELESGEPIWVPSMGFYVAKAGSGEEGRQYAQQWAAKGAKTIRQRVREREELTLDRTLDAYSGKSRPPIPAPGDDVKDKATLAGINLEPGMQIEIPDKTLLAAWRLAYWHVKRRALDKNADGNHIITDYWYGPIGAECATVIEALDSAGCEEEITRTGFEPWFKDQGKVQHVYGWFKDVDGTLLRASGDAQEETCSDGTAAMLYAMARHYQLTGNREWVKSRLSNLQAACQWIVRQRQWWANKVGRQSLSYGLFPPCGTGDLDLGIDPIICQTTQAWEYNGLKAAAEAIADVEPQSGAAFLEEAQALRQANLAAWEKAIALTPVVKVKDGASRRFMPSVPYLPGLCYELAPPTNAGEGELVWLMDGNCSVQLAFNILSPDDPRLDEALDVVEDNLFLAAEDKPDDAWFGRVSAKYLLLPAQCYVAMAHLRRDDVPNFLRATFTQYGCEISPQARYVFREGTTGFDPWNDKIQEAAAFVLRIRSMLVMEDDNLLYLARGTPRAWLEQGQKISVQNAPSNYGTVGYEIVSDVDNGKIHATLELPSRHAPQAVLLRLRHPKAAPIKSVTVNGKPWTRLKADRETIDLKGLNGTVAVVANY